MKFLPLPHAPANQIVLSIDVEDWHQLMTRRITGEFPPASQRVQRQVYAILELLDRQGARATFFVLGTIAQGFPDLIRQIHRQGHEIASHGLSHIQLFRLTPDQVREDIRNSVQLLEDITGEPILGYRAPEFSITTRNLWVLEIVAELGLCYDSSVFPIRHRRYGIPGFPRRVTQVHLSSGRQLLEFPMAARPWAGHPVPVAGGGYFRLLPEWFLKSAIRSVLREGMLPVLYFHPYEFDHERLQLPAKPGWAGLQVAMMEFMQNAGRMTLAGKLQAVLDVIPAVSFRDVLPLYLDTDRLRAQSR